MLQQQFIEELESSLGPERAGEVISYIENTPPSVSVRLNPFKTEGMQSVPGLPYDTERRTFSKWGHFLVSRPEFSLDPLFHAGAYYVQEASSMYLEHILPYMEEMWKNAPWNRFKVLDLCAAPGGKSTHLLSMLRGVRGAVLVSNEVIRTRATVLCENISKWGAANVVVTNSDPACFASLRGYFDVIVADAPCSGEGMFRKDPEAVAQWSPDNVRLCASRQRRILSDVLPALRRGGLLVYSTCTFNHYEDEDNAQWLASEYGMELLEQRHFYPGDDCAGEGFYMAVLKSSGNEDGQDTLRSGNQDRAGAYRNCGRPDWVQEDFTVVRRGNILKAFSDEDALMAAKAVEASSSVRVMMSGNAVGEVIEGKAGKSLVLPQYSLIQGESYRRGSLPEVEVPLDTALAYLRREPVTFRESPAGYLVLTYMGVPFGMVKNLGNRCNSLLPPSIALRKR